MSTLSNSQIPEVSLSSIPQLVWRYKIFIICFTAFFSGLMVAYAISKPNVYTVQGLYMPKGAEEGGSLAKLAGQFGGLASMAGINLGGGGGADKTALALEIIKSRSFIESFIAKHDLLVPLMAAKNWDLATDTLILNEKLYDEANKKWLREVKAPKKPEPSSWEAFRDFSEIITVSQDKASSMVNIDIEFYSPTIAKQWLTWLIKDINEFMREQDQIEAQASIDYLTEQLSEIEVATMETVFYQLIEEQTKNMMLTRVKKEYVLKTIDPAQVPDTKDKPKRALIVVLGTMLGGILSVLIVLIRYFSRKEK